MVSWSNQGSARGSAASARPGEAKQARRLGRPSGVCAAAPSRRGAAPTKSPLHHPNDSAIPKNQPEQRPFVT